MKTSRSSKRYVVWVVSALALLVAGACADPPQKAAGGEPLESVIVRAKERLRLGDAEGARELLEPRLDQGRDNPFLLVVLGQAQMQMGDLEGAKLVEKAAQIDPQFEIEARRARRRLRREEILKARSGPVVSSALSGRPTPPPRPTGPRTVTTSGSFLRRATPTPPPTTP